MGWFDGWFGSGSNNDSDPLRRLDPKLREFLERESPVKYNLSTPEQQQQPQQQQQQQQQPQPQSQTQQQQQDPSQPVVPPQSLFPDGRYAHLWKTYRPLAAIEAETKSDSEKLSDVVAAYKERRGMIGRAALENCAEEQSEWASCMKSGSWRARATMCRDEVHRFERCYAAQTRLLKALGYLSVYGRSPEVDEEIQMRADELYQKMVQREKEVEKARQEGREPPPFKGLFDDEVQVPAAPAAAKPASVGAGAASSAPAPAKEDFPEPGPALLAKWKEKLEKLPPEDREAEEKALRAEWRSKVEMARQVQGIWEEQARERKKRREEGKETIFDRVAEMAARWRGTKTD
ncbi:hypothetical protein VTJ04DRAFT_1462 [Mycothermus thermophilus]|uniref:uncharacterized protein n=1 Tax=Humicola insolens TaxID=85995 RepID=UPI003743195B